MHAVFAPTQSFFLWIILVLAYMCWWKWMWSINLRCTFLPLKRLRPEWKESTFLGFSYLDDWACINTVLVYVCFWDVVWRFLYGLPLWFSLNFSWCEWIFEWVGGWARLLCKCTIIKIKCGEKTLSDLWLMRLENGYISLFNFMISNSYKHTCTQHIV